MTALEDANPTTDVLDRTYEQIHNQTPRRTYSVAEVKKIAYPLIEEIDRLRAEAEKWLDEVRAVNEYSIVQQRLAADAESERDLAMALTERVRAARVKERGVLVKSMLAERARAEAAEAKLAALEAQPAEQRVNVGEVWRRKRDGRLVTVIRVKRRFDVYYGTEAGRVGLLCRDDFQEVYERVGPVPDTRSNT